MAPFIWENNRTILLRLSSLPPSRSSSNEIGIRLALGAMRGAVLGMVLRETLLLVLAGVAIGLPAALAGARLISARLFGIGAADPLTLAGAVLLMLGVAAAAGLAPARRASRVDPMVALRYE